MFSNAAFASGVILFSCFTGAAGVAGAGGAAGLAGGSSARAAAASARIDSARMGNCFMEGPPSGCGFHDARARSDARRYGSGDDEVEESVARDVADRESVAFETLPRRDERR